MIFAAKLLATNIIKKTILKNYKNNLVLCKYA